MPVEIAPKTEAPVPVPVPVPTGFAAKNKYGIAKDFLTIMVIPLFLWGVKLEVGNALRNERISNLQADLIEAVGELEHDLEGIGEVDAVAQDNTQNLIRLEGKIDVANTRLDEIKSLIKALTLLRSR